MSTMFTTLSARQGLSAMALSFPIVIWAKDNIYSLSIVRGTSMEPALKDGDVVLVRKIDILPIFSTNGNTDKARVQRIETSLGNPPSWLWDKPPLILAGSVVVFYNPYNTNYPKADLHVKRVIGLGGQMVRPAKRMRHVEEIPLYSLWLEGDNTANSKDCNSTGPVSKKLLVGQADRIIWPPSRWGLIQTKPPPDGRAWWP